MVPPGQKPRYPPWHGHHASIFLEQGIITVTSSDSLGNAVASGTPLNEDAAWVRDIDEAYRQQLQMLQQKVQAALPLELKNPAFQAGLRAIDKAAHDKQRQALSNYITSHPQSPVSLNALFILTSKPVDLALVEPLFKSLAPSLRATQLAQWYARDLEEARRTSIGAMAPDFTQTNPEGQPVKLSDFRGKYVLLDFWAN
jgi:hypothetical protein